MEMLKNNGQKTVSSPLPHLILPQTIGNLNEIFQRRLQNSQDLCLCQILMTMTKMKILALLVILQRTCKYLGLTRHYLSELFVSNTPYSTTKYNYICFNHFTKQISAILSNFLIIVTFCLHSGNRLTQNISTLLYIASFYNCHVLLSNYIFSKTVKTDRHIHNTNQCIKIYLVKTS